VVSVFSKKNMSRSDISKRIQKRGTPIVVSGDTNPPSKTIEKVNAAFSSRIIIPQESLSVADKIRITQYLQSLYEEKLFSNRHERDALASACFAFNRIKSLIARINKALSENSLNPDMERSVKTEVILNRKNIKNTIEKYKNINGKA
jgi:predicted RNase H-like nuclease (RuvC/YqgF family)